MIKSKRNLNRNWRVSLNIYRKSSKEINKILRVLNRNYYRLHRKRTWRLNKKYNNQIKKTQRSRFNNKKKLIKMKKRLKKTDELKNLIFLNK